MYVDAPPFHSTKPCHLPLCKLVNGNFKLPEHLVVADTSNDIFGDIFVFKAIIYKVFSRYSPVYQPFHFFYHAFLEP